MASLAGGFEAFAQAISVEADDATHLWLQIRPQTFFWTRINLANTVAAGTGDCRVNNSKVSKSDLLRKLDDALKARVTFLIQVDRSALGVPSGRNKILQNWAVADTFFRLWIGGQDNTEVAWPGVYTTVTQTGPNAFRFSGGLVTIRANGTTKGSGHFSTAMLCQNLDAVDVVYPVNP